jgi:O-antigen ligase
MQMPLLSLSSTEKNSQKSVSILFALLIGSVALAPLPLGSNRHWAWELLGAIIGLLMALLAIRQILDRDEVWPRLQQLRVPALLFSGAISWAMMQSLPFTPEPWHHPLWSQAQDYFAHQVLTSVSVNRTTSISHMFRLITYGGIFWLSYSFSHDVRRARIVTKSVTMIIALYAAWGLAVYWTGNKTILWFDKWGYTDDLTGTFVNRNSFATFLGLGLLTGVAMLIEGIRKRVDFLESSRGVLKATLELLMVHGRWLTLGCLVIVTALLLTHSRGGAISTVIGLAALLGAVGFAPSLRAHWHTTFGLGLAVALGAILAISDNVMTKRLVESSVKTEGRVHIFERTLEAIHDWPLFGTGLGTFGDIFPLYRTENIAVAVGQAHNDYLETVIELGLPAATLLFLSIASLLWICLSGIRRRRRDAVFPCIGVGATTLVAVHSLFDFSLQIPAVTSIYWILMGTAIAQSFNSLHSAK